MKKSKLQAKSATPKPAAPPSRSNLLQRTCQCGAVPGVTGECEKCASQRLSDSLGTINQAGGLNDRSAPQSYHFGDLAIAPKQRLGIQAKLTIGQPNDKYEQEADRVAEQVMRMPDPEAALQRQSKKPEEDEEKQKRLQRKPLPPQGEPAGAEEDEDKKKRLQRKPMAETGHKVSVELQDRIQHLQQQGGQPLSGSEKAFFEPRFGQDFSQVRLHADAETADVARSVNARAFTVGRDVVFGPGQYQPRSPEGQRLLAHELTHVVQQNGGTVQRAPINPVLSAPLSSSPSVTPDQVVVTNNGQGVTADSIQVLKEIVASIGETSATITSGRRTPSEQAAAMYTNLEATSVAAQKDLYGSSGDKVIDVYVAGKAATPIKDAATIKQEMTNKINELGPSTVSKHCSNNSVIDVAPSSITNDAEFAIKAQAHVRVTKYLGPNTTPTDPAHHLEIT